MDSEPLPNQTQSNSENVSKLACVWNSGPVVVRRIIRNEAHIFYDTNPP